MPTLFVLLMPLLFVYDLSDAFTACTRVSDAFTEVSALYCSYQSFLMPTLFVHDLSDAFTVCTRDF